MLSLRWRDEDRMIRVETEEMSLITLAVSPGWTWPTLTGSSWRDKQVDKLPQPECVSVCVDTAVCLGRWNQNLSSSEGKSNISNTYLIKLLFNKVLQADAGALTLTSYLILWWSKYRPQATAKEVSRQCLLYLTASCKMINYYGIKITFMHALRMSKRIPAWSQIWARVIQGCRGPCLGALLCREEATSDRACSTRLAAMEVACTEPGGWKSNHHRRIHQLPNSVTNHYNSSVRQPCATMQGDFNWTKQQQRPLITVVLQCLVAVNSWSPHWHTVFQALK